MDEWGNYPKERQRLFDLIGETDAGDVVLLSGNVHFSEISHVLNGGIVLHEFTSSGLTHVNEAYADAENPYRVAGPCKQISFGLIELDWSEQPQISLRAVGVEGETILNYSIVIDSSN